MKHKMKLVVGVSLVSLVVFSGLAIAQGQETGEEAQLYTTTEATKPDASPQNDTLEKRLQTRKDRLKVHLTVLEKNRLTARCKNAQGLLQSAEVRIKGVETSRKQVYDNLLTKLKAVAERLAQQNATPNLTASLQTHITTAEQRIQTLNENIASYRQAVADLATMDCAADPEGFKAALLEARQLAQLLRSSDREIRDHFKKSIRVTLQSIRAELAVRTDNTEEAQGE